MVKTFTGQTKNIKKSFLNNSENTAYAKLMKKKRLTLNYNKTMD